MAINWLGLVLGVYFVSVVISFLYSIYYTNRKLHLNNGPILSKEDSPLVSIVVPTYNEESNIENCLRSLKALNYPNYEIIVSDGGSTDNTVEVAKPLADKVVINYNIPNGWIGKSWACHYAMINAVSDKAELLLFTDADTYHESDSLSYAVGHLNTKNRDLLSCLPFQKLQKWWESMIPVFFILSILVPGGTNKINNPEKKKSFTASGQYLLFRRSSYDAIGGHERIKGSIIEDVALAKVIKTDLGGLLWVESDKLIHTRMYPDSFKSFWEGFKKVIISGTKFYRPIGILITLMISLWAILAPFELIMAFFDGSFMIIITTSISFVAFPIILYAGWKGRGKHHWMMYLLYSLSFVVFIGIVISSFIDLQIRKRVTWRGKTYTQLDLHAGLEEDKY